MLCMQNLALFFFLSFSVLPVCAGTLPDIFYKTSEEQRSFCLETDNQTEIFWRNLIDHKITDLIGNGSAVIQNAWVNLSYLELYRMGKDSSAGFMGYVYANGSHHLGRLVRFNKWPKEHPLKDSDRALVKGTALRLVARAASHELSRRLMLHSLRLYKELAWSMASAVLCGNDYALSIVSHSDLKQAFMARSKAEFITPFVTYEQSYLQENMYSDWLIGGSARAGVLDEMRFISFNGESQVSFHEWCREKSCPTTSLDLDNRIEFDTYSIMRELDSTQGKSESLNVRLQQAKIIETAVYFLQASGNWATNFDP